MSCPKKGDWTLQGRRTWKGDLVRSSWEGLETAGTPPGRHSRPLLEARFYERQDNINSGSSSTSPGDLEVYYVIASTNREVTWTCSGWGERSFQEKS